MTAIAAYRDLYPRSGDLALLCEGDLAGYDTSLLRKWIDRTLGGALLVDIWPCGTGEALFGVSDAIGRSRPILVIEDLDFRDAARAEKECRFNKKDRRRRDVKLVDWRCWHRNEIENYFLDEPVLLPVMCEWFPSSEDEVRGTLAEVISALGVFQAAEYALYHVRKEWGKSDPTSVLRAELNHRPQFSDADRRLVAAEHDTVWESLQRNIAKWQERLLDGGEAKEPFLGGRLLDRFHQKCDAWTSQAYDDPAWRIEWSGKEVLQGLRMVLTARHGWPDADTGERQPLAWEGLSRTKLGEQDRLLEKEMQNDLVNRAVDYLCGLTEGELVEEWSAIEAVLRDPTAALAE